MELKHLQESVRGFSDEITRQFYQVVEDLTKKIQREEHANAYRAIFQSLTTLEKEAQPIKLGTKDTPEAARKLTARLKMLGRCANRGQDPTHDTQLWKLKDEVEGPGFMMVWGQASAREIAKECGLEDVNEAVALAFMARAYDVYQQYNSSVVKGSLVEYLTGLKLEEPADAK
jgi:hypothetical protein